MLETVAIAAFIVCVSEGICTRLCVVSVVNNILKSYYPFNGLNESCFDQLISQFDSSS